MTKKNESSNIVYSNLNCSSSNESEDKKIISKLQNSEEKEKRKISDAFGIGWDEIKIVVDGKSYIHKEPKKKFDL